MTTKIHAGGHFCGLQLVPSPFMSERKQIRFPRSKKRRMRKKWAKNPGNYAVIPWKTAYRIGNVIYAHPAMIENIIRELKEER